MDAVVIDAAEAIIVVRCIFRCDLDPSCVCSRGQQHTFVLMEGEYIERLNARLSDEVLVSLKIRTSLRSSQWIGSGQCEWQQSKLSQLDEIRAPQGYCISSLFGSHIRERCYQVGCTFEPLTRSSRIDPIPFFNSQRKTSQYRTQVNRETSPYYIMASLLGLLLTNRQRLRVFLFRLPVSILRHSTIATTNFGRSSQSLMITYKQSPLSQASRSSDT